MNTIFFKRLLLSSAFIGAVLCGGEFSWASSAKIPGSMHSKKRPSNSEWRKHFNHHHPVQSPPAIHATDSEIGAGIKLHEAIQRAVTTNPKILASRAAHTATSYKIDQARAGYFPTLDFRGDAGYEGDRQKFSSNQLNRAPIAGSVSTPRYGLSLSARQMIFDGFQTPSQVKKAKKEKTQAHHKIMETEELVGFNTADAYISVRRFGRLIRLAEENIKTHEAILQKVDALVRAGKEALDAKKNVEARLGDARAALRDIESDYNAAIARYYELVGEEPGRLPSSEIPSHLLPVTRAEALEIAQEHNKSLQLAHATVSVVKADAKITEAPFWPRFDLEIDGRRNWNASTQRGQEHSVTALGVLRYNLFSGGKDEAKKQELRAKITEAKFQAMDQKRRTEEAVRTSWANMSSAYQQSLALRDSVKAKEAVRNAYMTQFQTGKRSFMDILDASHEYFLAKGSLVTADAVHDIASIRLLASMGVLNKRLKDLTI